MGPVWVEGCGVCEEVGSVWVEGCGVCEEVG